MAPLHYLKDRVSEYFPSLQSENTNPVKKAPKIWEETNYTRPHTQYSRNFIAERFLYDYKFDFKVPLVCTFDYLVAKASKDLSAYSVFDYELFQLSFNFLHPTTKDVQNNNYRVLETKLIDNLIYNTFFPRQSEQY